MRQKTKPEIHLFIIWEKGRDAEEEIINDISSNFEIIQTFSITWTPYLVSTNYSRFYDTKLPSNSQKETYAGSGEFKLIVVKDTNPSYADRETSKGKAVVNTRMFDAKARYRKLTGGGHKIHSTNDLSELKHDLVLLLGLSMDDFLIKYDKDENKEDIKLFQDLAGTLGWNSSNELFYVLNECNEYLVLLNSENISTNYFEENNDHVGLPVKDRNRCIYLLGDLSSIDSETNDASKVSINNKTILFEFYEVGHNLFDKNYEKHLFENKYLKGNMYCLPKELEFYILLYNALLFHEELPENHLNEIIKLIKGRDDLKTLIVDQKNLTNLLTTHFKNLGYHFIAPNDSAVYFNFNLLKNNPLLQKNKKRASKFMIYVSQIIQVKSFKKYRKVIFLSFLNNEIDVLFGFRFRFMKKEIKFSLGDKRKYKY